MKQGLLLLVLYGTLLSGCAQDIQEKSIDYYGLVRQHFTGKTAFATTDYVEDYWRVVGNTGFNNTIYLLADSLQAAGYVLEENAEEGDRLTYRIERRPMDHQTWEPISASLHIVGEDTPLLHADTNRNMTYLYSASTPKEGISAEVVWIKSMHDLTSVSLKNKVVFAEMNGRQLYKAAIKKGALGMLTYDNPSYLQPEKNTTSIQFRSLPSQSDPDFWGIALSYEAKEKLVAKLTKGTTKVVAHIQTKKYPSEELTIVADIKGGTLPNERLVYSAHIQEPGANDNATGVGAQLEMAMIAAKLVSEGKIELQRTMTFLWGDEIISTRRYIEENPDRAEGIKWGISLDMVGENTTVTGGTFLIEKMPDPSAIWTRGNDKHSEWGGEVLSMEEMRPHYLNDFIITTFKEQGKFANWVVETNPFEGGSDHTPFLNANIPGLLLWHFTDQFYHTDNDRIDKVSQKTLKNVGTAALVSGLKLVNAESGFALEQIATLEKKALLRLQDEYDLSVSAIEKGGNPAEQLSILTAWKDWYIGALLSTQDVLSNTSLTKKQLNGAKAKIEKKYEEKKKQLVK
ncbi:M28 family peptidase [Maribacter sp. MAR_2009_72]|uniref:M28 family peptidase n=1 Tax=Maribacter sp. MAR_2009_72 TaxID=1250050 RepID=UPI001199F460|nr:M28 family peptidase [Maribacter sp. MAR_2009_72]TVZ16249.1 Zn-dependent M28 family amino/carboxypeptidase [Maribacter sp. MAR_2009_72]